MSDSANKPEKDETPPTQPSTPASSEPKRDVQQTNGAAGPGPGESPREWLLKQGLEQYRLPPDLKAQILAELPPPEERERLLLELIEEGGLSSEEFLASLGIEVEPKP